MRRYTIAAFVSSGLLTAFAGILLASRLRIGQASVGLEYLLPALVGAFLGSTTIKPGRVNVWGTIVGVTILAIGISGIQQFGASFFVEPLFNGATTVNCLSIASVNAGDEQDLTIHLIATSLTPSTTPAPALTWHYVNSDSGDDQTHSQGF